MKCEFDKTLLSFYLDKELSEKEALKVELHLEKCRNCQKTLSELQEINNALHNLEEVEVSPDYDVRFKNRLDELISKKQKKAKITPDERKSLWDELKDILSQTPTMAKVAVPAALVLIVSFALFAVRPGHYPTVITAKGTVQQYDGKTDKWRVLESGDKLTKGDLIKTAKNSFIDVELDGLYKLRIKPESEVKANSIIRSRRQGLTQYEINKGNILVKIDKNLEESKFQIKTPFGIAEATGTAFMVDTRADPQYLAREVLLGVSEGTVLVKTHRKNVYVKKDEKIVLESSGSTRGPYPLQEKEEEDLKEIKEIGKIFVILGISNTAERTRELLEPSRLYAYGKYPIQVGNILDRGLVLLSRAVKTDSRRLHLASIRELNRIVENYPAKRYNPQLLLFLGSYYEYLSLHAKAIDTFKQVVDRYPYTQWASIAILAQAIIYEEKMGETDKAQSKYERILSDYSDTPEAEYIIQLSKH